MTTVDIYPSFNKTRWEVPGWMKKYLGIWAWERGQQIRSKYFEWNSPKSGKGVGFSIHALSYSDEVRSMIHIMLPVFGQIFIYIPYLRFLDTKDRNGDGYDIEHPKYGFSFRYGPDWGGNSISLEWGKKHKTIYLPWTPVNTLWQTMLKDGSWVDGHASAHEDTAYQESHDFYHMLNNGEVQHVIATCRRERAEWKWRWFGKSHIRPDWCEDAGKVINPSPVSDFLRKIQVFGIDRQDRIDIRFSDEVGARRGSWKGGTVGMSTNMKPEESIYNALMRIQKEGNFR